MSSRVVNQSINFIGIKESSAAYSIVLNVCTLGAFYTICRLSKWFRLHFQFTECNLEVADHVILVDQYQNTEIYPITQVRVNPTLGLIRYIYNYHASEYINEGKVPFFVRILDTPYSRFIYDYKLRLFVSPPFSIPHIKNVDEYITSLLQRPLSDEVKELYEKRVIYGGNSPKIIPATLLGIVDRACFDVIFIWEMASVVIWISIEFYAYAVVTGAIFLFAHLKGIYDDYTNRDLPPEATEVRVFREGAFKDVDEDDVFPGDIVYVDKTDSFKCDVEILKGDVITDESFLTGETVPICKGVGQCVYSGTKVIKSSSIEYSREDLASSKSMQKMVKVRNLFSKEEHALKHHENAGNAKSFAMATKQISSSAIGVVVKTGRHTKRGKLLQNMQIKSQHTNVFDEQSRRIITNLMLASGIVVILYIIYLSLYLDITKVLEFCSDLFMTFFSPSLYTCLKLGIIHAQNALINVDIKTTDRTKITVAGEVDVVIFDKTGTLTEIGLDILLLDCMDRIVDEFAGLQNILKIGISSCHSVLELDGEYSGDILDMKMFLFSNSKIHTDGKQRWITIDQNCRSEFNELCREYSSDKDPDSAADHDQEYLPASYSKIESQQVLADGYDCNYHDRHNMIIAKDNELESYTTYLTTKTNKLRKKKDSRWHKPHHKIGKAAKCIKLQRKRAFNDKMVSVCLSPTNQLYAEHIKRDISSDEACSEGSPALAGAQTEHLNRSFSSVHQYLQPGRGAKGIFDAKSNKLQSEPEFNGEIEVIKIFEFNSFLKRMSVVVRLRDGRRYIFCKGASECIKRILREIPSSYDRKTQEYAISGHRIITMAYSQVSDDISIEHSHRKDLENNLTFGSFIVFANKLKTETVNVISELNESSIQTRMCTGDNILTAISVARECSMIAKDIPVLFPVIDDNAASYLDADWLCVADENLVFDKVKMCLYSEFDKNTECEFVIAIEGKEYEAFKETMYHSFIINKGIIFARFNPENKKDLIEDLVGVGLITMFCGDGANDSGALSVADVGLSLADNEASLIAPFNSPYLHSVLDLIKEGRSALAMSISQFKYIFYSQLLAGVQMAALLPYLYFPSDYMSLLNDLLSCYALGYTLSMFKCNNVIYSQKIKIDLLGDCSTILVEMIGIFLVYCTALFFCHDDPAVNEIKIETKHSTVLFITTLFLFIYKAFFFADFGPYRQSRGRNSTFLWIMLGSLVVFASMVAFIWSNCECVMDLFEFSRLGSIEYKIAFYCWCSTTMITFLFNRLKNIKSMHK